MEQKIQDMVENLSKFGIDAQYILEFSDYDMLEKIHDAMKEYRQNKNGSQTNDSIW